MALTSQNLQGQRVPDIAKSVKALVAELLPSALDGSLRAPGKPRSKAATPEGTPAAEEGSAVEDSNGNDVDTDLSLYTPPPPPCSSPFGF